MRHTIIVMCLAALATASISTTEAQYPERSSSMGFHLVLNVTDLSRDLAAFVHRKYVNSIHVGPPQNLLGPGTVKNARIFYQNGTKKEIAYGSPQIASDGGGTPKAPYGVTIRLDGGSTNVSTFWLDAGEGQRGVGISEPPSNYAFVNLKKLAVCNEPVPYYGGKTFNILKQFLAHRGEGHEIPGNCVPVRLLPQCTRLNELDKGSYASHEFAQLSACYKDVSAIDWSKYPDLSENMNE